MSQYQIFKRSSTGPIQKKDVPLFITLGLTPTRGSVGLELEMESETCAFPKERKYVPEGWVYHHDDSLRGLDNAEYVLESPCEFEEVKESVDKVFKALLDYNTVHHESNRASTHVHLNAQLFTLRRLATFLGLFYTVEDVLSHWCGEHRVGNLFCLRAKDVPAVVSEVRKFITSGGEYSLDDGLHYAGVNLHSLRKFGSIEIRHMRGAMTPKDVTDWVSILQHIYELSGTYRDPRSCIADFSCVGHMGFLRKVVGEDMYHTVVESCGLTSEEIRDSLQEGVRLAQQVCYCREWQNFPEATVEVDPSERIRVEGHPLSIEAMDYVSSSHVDEDAEEDDEPYYEPDYEDEGEPYEL